MRLWSSFKTSWWRLFFSCLAIVVCWLYVDEINYFIANKLSGIIELERIYDAIQDNLYLNAIIFCGVVVGFYQILRKRFKDRYFSFLRSTLAACLIILLYFQDKWDYATTIIPFVKYNTLLSLGAKLYVLSSIVIQLVVLFKGKGNGKKKGKNLSLFSDSEGRIKISESREKYATLLAERLLRTDVSKEAYAVGIAGEWGSGKTVFLDAVEKSLNDRVIVIKFNPWNSQNEKHLTKDFFDTLSKILSPYYSGISSPIHKYASLLYSLRINVASKYFLQYLPKNEERDLAGLKEDVETALDKLGKLIVVIIDDIDRLEGKEIFEVLRLIRNTAVFRNMFYVVAYDKEHVVSQLSSLEIENGKDYLERIFQIEVQLPKPDERVLIEEFKKTCRAMTQYTSSMNSLFDRLSEEEYHQITKVLTSFRKVRRFARQFSFNANYMMDSFTDRAFELTDLLFLNLIEYHNFTVFKTLWHNPNALLETKTHIDTQTKYYQWSEEKDKREELDDPIYMCLMNKLFGGIPDSKSHSVQFTDLFYKYFYLAQPEQELSLEDFQKMLKMSEFEFADNGMMATIRSWVSSKENKSINSIFHHFINYDTVNQKDFNKCVRFLRAAFFWIEIEDRENNDLKELLPRILTKSRFSEAMKENIQKWVDKNIRVLSEKENYRNTALVLSELYRRIDQGEKFLIDIDAVESALQRNTELFLQSNAWDPISLYVNDGNYMRAVVDANCVSLKSNLGKKKNLVIKQVINYFKIPEHKSGSYVRANTIYQTIPLYSSNGDGGGSTLGDLSQTFGDDYKNLAIEMLRTCFKGVSYETE